MDEALLKRARDLIAANVGLQVHPQDDELLRKVVAARVKALDLPGVQQYCELLRLPAGLQRERQELATALTTGETHFFRDSGQHALLESRILPELLERHQATRSLRIWSAGCSSGEETYSLAIMLDELMADQTQWDILILGTDINPLAIEKARRARYSDWSFRGVSEERRRRYFHHHRDALELDDRIRSRVRFLRGDLVGDRFPDYSADLHDMDLILCRNTFIYMTPAVISLVADKLTETLAAGGILVTGHGELYAHHLGKLRARVFPESIVYQKTEVPSISPMPELPARVSPPAAMKAATALQVRRKVTHPAPVPTPQHLALASEKPAPEMELAWRYANEGRRDMADQICRGMIAANPLDAEPHYLLALLAQEHGDFAKAKDLLRKVIYLAPASVAAYLDLGDLYEREGDPAKAARMRSTALDFLRTLPGDERVKLYGASTANEVLHYVEHLLNMGNQ